MALQALTNSATQLSEMSLPHEELFNLLIEHTPAAIALLDSQMRYIKVSRRWLSDFGLSDRDIIGKSHCEVFAIPVDRASEIYRCCQTGAIETWEEELLQQESSASFKIKWQASPWYAGDIREQQSDNSDSLGREICGTILFAESSLHENLVRELAKREAAQIALKQSEAKFQKLSANVPGMIYQFLLCSDGFVSFPFVSSGCYSLFGLKSEDIETNAHHLISIIHPDDRDRFNESVTVSAQTLQPWKWEGRFILASGEIKWIQAASQPERYDNGDILWDGLLIDVTARKISEAEVQKAKQQLELRVLERTGQLTRAVKQLETEIVERQKTETELRESQQRLSLFFQQTQLAVIERNAALEVTVWNPAAESIFGYSREEAIGQCAAELIVPESAREQVNQVMNAVLLAGRGNRSINQNLTKDGRIIVCDWYNTPLIDRNGVLVGLASLALDISDRVATETALRENEERYRTVVEKASDGIFLVDVVTKRILETNAACCNSLGYTAEEMLQLTLYDIIAVAPKIIDRVARNILKNQYSFQGEKKHRHKNGYLIDVDVNVNVISYGGTDVFCVIFRDVTERKQAQEALQKKAEELERSLSQLTTTQAQLFQTEKISSLGQLVAGVAHEVNNPVSFICGNLHHATHYTFDLLDHLQLYQQHYPNPPVEIQNNAEEIDLEFLAEDLPKMLCSMQLGTNRIQEIMQSLRNFSRVDGADVKPANIHDLLDSTLMILQHRLKAQASRPAIEVVKEYGNLPLVECYSGQLNQVFMNILANAIDAFDEYNRGKTYDEIDRNPNTIRICTEAINGDRVTIRIKDNGPGMVESVRQKLFDPFFTTKPVGKGTGLGLSISYRIVTEIHKGQIECISAPGQGTEFAIALPIKRD